MDSPLDHLLFLYDAGETNHLSANAISSATPAKEICRRRDLKRRIRGTAAQTPAGRENPIRYRPAFNQPCAGGCTLFAFSAERVGDHEPISAALIADKAEWKFRIVESGRREKNEAPIVIRFCLSSRDPCGHTSDNSCPRASHAEGGSPKAVHADTVRENRFAHAGGSLLSFFLLDEGFHFRAEDKL